jgi:hypothetical protein
VECGDSALDKLTIFSYEPASNFHVGDVFEGRLNPAGILILASVGEPIGRNDGSRETGEFDIEIPGKN